MQRFDSLIKSFQSDSSSDLSLFLFPFFQGTDPNNPLCTLPDTCLPVTDICPAICGPNEKSCSKGFYNGAPIGYNCIAMDIFDGLWPGVTVRWGEEIGGRSGSQMASIMARLSLPRFSLAFNIKSLFAL